MHTFKGIYIWFVREQFVHNFIFNWVKLICALHKYCNSFYAVKWSQLLLSNCYIARYMDVWNRHRETRNSTKIFIHLFEFKGFSTWGKRETQSFYADFSICPHHVRHPAANYWSSLGELRKSTFFLRGKNSTHCFFSNLSPRSRCMTSPKYPGPNIYLGFLFWHLWMTSSPHAREHLR